MAGGRIIGKVVKQTTLRLAQFKIYDGNRESVLRIEGPVYESCICCNDVPYKILTADGSFQIVQIIKISSERIAGCGVTEESYSIKFQKSLDSNMKGDSSLFSVCFYGKICVIWLRLEYFSLF